MLLPQQTPAMSAAVKFGVGLNGVGAGCEPESPAVNTHPRVERVGDRGIIAD